MVKFRRDWVLFTCIDAMFRYDFIEFFLGDGLQILQFFTIKWSRVAVQAWSLWTKQDIEKIESVQKIAIGCCHGLHGSTYEEKLAEVGLTTQVDCRRRGDMFDMLQTFKMLNTYVVHES